MKKILHAVHHHGRIFYKHAKTSAFSKHRVAYLLFGILNTIFILQILTVFVSPPRTTIGETPFGFLTKKEIASKLEAFASAPVRLQINNRIYTYFYRDIGVYLDIDQTINSIFAPNTLPFPKNIVAFISTLFFPQTIKPPLYFSQEFDEFIQKTVYDFSEGDDIMLFDQDEKRMTLYQQEVRYGLHPTHVKTYLSDTFATLTDPLMPPLTPLNTDAQNKVQKTNAKIADVFSTPLTVIMRINNADRFFTIDQKDLQRDVEVTMISDDENLATFTPSDALLTLYTNNVMYSEEKEQLASTKKRLSTAIEKALQDRYRGMAGESVHVNVDSGPNSDGSLANRYIEIDISQQRMYTFNKGTLVKTYRVSTGKDYPTPVGTFEILNKTGLGFSTIYNVWMPYWMGFNFSKELHAYFGIHELPYYYSAGNKIQRPRDFIGVPNTGGCVALDIGDAKEVYKFADIGTKVVIYQ